VPGIRGLIACNDKYTLRLVQGLDALVLAGITLLGEIQITEDLVLRDPSLVQFAAAVNSEKSLKVLLQKSATELKAQPPRGPAVTTAQTFRDILRPKGTNTKIDALTIAALVHTNGPNKLGEGRKRLTALDFLLKYIADNEHDRTNGFSVDSPSYDGRTPLWHACALGHWAAAQRLHAARADFLAAQSGVKCPVVAGPLAKNGADFATEIVGKLEREPGRSWLSVVAGGVLWGENLQPASAESGGQRLSKRLANRAPPGVEEKLMAAEGIQNPDVIVEGQEEPAGVKGRKEAEAPAERIVCGWANCAADEALGRCERCHVIFSAGHINDHNCPR
jgi:hypothetical protein